MGFLDGSFKIGRAFGIDIRVHMLFVLLIGYLLISSGPAWQHMAWFYGMLFGIILMHEFGHCFGARAVGGHADTILMWPLGGLAFAQAPMTPWAQFVTVAAGPAVNVVFCLVSGAVLIFMSGTPWVLPLIPFEGLKYEAIPRSVFEQLPVWFWYVGIFYQVNLFLLAFNMLPIYPLDGGQLFQCLLWPFVGLHQAMDIACKVGLAGCVILGFLAISGQFGGPFLIFIALFGGFTCWQRLQQLRYGMVIDERIKRAPVRRWDPPGAPRRSFWQRIFGTSRNTRPHSSVNNPAPGAWQAKLDEERQVEEEVDRILAKVSREGVHSLTERERRTLERRSREHRDRERRMQDS